MTDSGWASTHSTATVKASALLAVVAIWAAMIPAVVRRPDAWWSLIFAFAATCAIGLPPWRSLGFGRLLAVAAAWGATAAAVSTDDRFTWVSVFAFLTTLTAVHNWSWRRRSIGGGVVTATAWAVTGTVLAVNQDPDAAWICIFAFLTGASVIGHRGSFGTLVAIAAWIGAGVLMLNNTDAYASTIGASLVATVAVHALRFRAVRHFEWDLFDRDDDSFAAPGARG